MSSSAVSSVIDESSETESSLLAEVRVWAVVVTYNAEKWVVPCLQSLIASTCVSRVVVVDNNSSDATLTLIADIQRNLVAESEAESEAASQVQLELVPLTQNVGFGRANNVGIRKALEADADYIFLLNQDAYVAPDMVEQLLKVARVHDDYGVLSPVHRSYDGTQLEAGFAGYMRQQAAEFLSDAAADQMQPLYPVYFVPAALWLLRREAVEAVGGFDPVFFMYGEDDDLAQRFHYSGWKMGVVSQAIGFHWHGGPGKQKISRGRLVRQAYTRWVLELKRRDTPFSRNLLRFGRESIRELGQRAFQRRLDRMGVILESQIQVLRRLATIKSSRQRSIAEPRAFLFDEDLDTHEQISAQRANKAVQNSFVSHS